MIACRIARYLCCSGSALSSLAAAASRPPPRSKACESDSPTAKEHDPHAPTPRHPSSPPHPPPAPSSPTAPENPRFEGKMTTPIPEEDDERGEEDDEVQV